MQQERLGLFDTPPSRREIWLSLAVIGALIVGGLLTFPVSHVQLGESAPFIPTIHAISFVCDLIIATILYAQAAVVRTRSLTVLASGFVFMGLLVPAYVLTFPGAFAPDGLLGAGINTAAWIMLVRRFAFPLLVIAYVLAARLERAGPPEEHPPPLRTAAWFAGAVILAAAVILLAVFSPEWLPPVFVSRDQASASTILAINISNIAIVLAAIGLLSSKRLSLLDMWLLAALATWLVLSVFHLAVTTRFTVGFYTLHFAMMAAHFLVLIALIAEANRLYMRLALSTAAQGRERDRHFMTVSAMAATFSHEIGQPLTAVTTNAAAGLSWLDRPEPEVGRAIQALREVLEGVHRTNNVAKGLRALIADESREIDEFSINDLARQTAASLERELAADSISLRFDLNPAVPPVRADRGQLQQVLINLIFNAIESLRETNGRARRITLRSARLDGGGALLQVSDTGDGIAASPIERIFEPFMTTKSAGMGIGLSICRNIVEEYGGKLWASNDEPYGATFHLQLPILRAAH